MALVCSNRFGQVVGDEVCWEAWPSGKETLVDGFDEGGWGWGEKGPVIIDSQVYLSFHNMDIVGVVGARWTGIEFWLVIS